MKIYKTINKNGCVHLWPLQPTALDSGTWVHTEVAGVPYGLTENWPTDMPQNWPIDTIEEIEMNDWFGMDYANKETETAEEFLTEAVEVMQERGKQYDSPQGERSMGKTVGAFNIITGYKLTEADGWLFMEILKNVRQAAAPTYHNDSAVDGVAYSALKAEALAGGR